MNISSWYASHFEPQLRGRYVSLESIFPLLDVYRNFYEISILGESEKHRDIPLIKLGFGKKKVLAWSQMHGNETTTTKAIFDFLKFLSQKVHFQDEIRVFLDRYTLYIIPMLNPDGAERYTRENANSIDLNRDAQNLSQKESVVLRTVFDLVQPDLCLNLHDQRTIYGLDSGLPATVSFLAPAADEHCSITLGRETAMEHIVRMSELLQGFIPGQVGRYDDAFNINCVGDTFQNAGVPTILFEAGHYQKDYHREKTREYIFYAFLSLFEIIKPTESVVTYKDYFNIPENKVNFKDIILRNVRINHKSEPTSIAIQYVEVLDSKEIQFEGIVDAMGNLDGFRGHYEKDCNGNIILINSQKNVGVGEKVVKIIAENNESVVYFPVK